MHREIESDQLGHAVILPSDGVKVNTRGTWIIRYTVGNRPLQTEGKIRITIPHGFTAPQTKAFFDPGFVTAETCSEGVSLSIEIISDIFCRWDLAAGHSGAWGRSIFITISGRNMVAGESIDLIYGNAEYYGKEPFGHAGAVTRELSGSADFFLAVDPDGKRAAPHSGYWRVKPYPRLEILPGDPVQYRAIIPANITKGDTVVAHILEIDEFNNPVEVAKKPHPINSEGIIRECLPYKSRTLLSNPIIVSEGEPEFKLLWGDIHGHTINSDGLGTPDEYYRYGRDTALLDFAAITDHDDIGPRLSDADWNETKEAAEKFHSPREFITFLGHEYRNGLCDMNVYFPAKEGPLTRGVDAPNEISSNLTQIVKTQGGMIIPHMHFGADWSGFDSKVYRVMEIYSQHGSAEYRGCPREIPYLRKQLQKSSKTNTDCYAHEILNLGYRLGFTAGSDTHSGRPGFSDWTRACRTYLGGLTGIYAKNKTREGIWAALKSRRCYATTGNRSILQFTLNDLPMGSEVNLRSGEQRNFFIFCVADGDLHSIIIFKSGKIWYEQDLEGESLILKLEDKNSRESDWYYVRLMLSDGGMVWSSPIWVEST